MDRIRWILVRQGQRLSQLALPIRGSFHEWLLQYGALQLGAVLIREPTYGRFYGFHPTTVFAIDPFAGRLGVYDPSLSIQITQDCPALVCQLGLKPCSMPVIVDAQATTDNGDGTYAMLTGRRSVRGGISVRF